VRDELAGLQRAGVGEPGDQAGQGVVGDGEQHQAGAARHLVAGSTGTPGSSVAGALAGGVGDRETATTSWPARASAAPEHGADAAGTDDADAQAGGGRRGEVMRRSSPARGTGRVRHHGSAARPARPALWPTSPGAIDPGRPILAP
jgi:hypothetical protein